MAVFVISWLVWNKGPHMISNFKTLMTFYWWTWLSTAVHAAFIAKFTITEWFANISLIGIRTLCSDLIQLEHWTALNGIPTVKYFNEQAGSTSGSIKQLRKIHITYTVVGPLVGLKLTYGIFFQKCVNFWYVTRNSCRPKVDTFLNDEKMLHWGKK